MALTSCFALEKSVDGEIKGAIDEQVAPMKAEFDAQQKKANAAFDEVKKKLRDTQHHYLTMLSKTGDDTSEQIEKLRDAMNRAQTDYDADVLKSTGMANQLFAMVQDQA